jgi:hypothetical protein
MGQVQCQTHGRQSGPLCCDHVREASERKGALGSAALVEFEVDLTDDQAHLLPHLICPSCAEHFGVAENSRVSGALAEKPGHLPDVAPTCQACVNSWRDSMASRVGDA